MGTRILLLFSLVWVTHLTKPLFYLFGQSVSGRDIVLLGGGLFLLVKSVLEMHQTLERAAPNPARTKLSGSFTAVIVQIGLIDIVFSLDSVFTAVGLAKDLKVMVAAIVVAIVVMMLVSRSIGAFIARHPTIKVLALAFLLLIGFALVAEGVHFEIPKGYLYFAMAFSVGVELINTRVRRRQDRRG
jgi:predicted tellurium resistance membrane protein TerC